MDATGPCTHLPGLADALWSERHLLEHLVFKLVTHHLLLEADDRRFVARAVDEIDQAIDELWAADAARVTALGPVAEQRDLATTDVTLTLLIGERVEPWASMFAEHRSALRRAATEIQHTGRASRVLACCALVEIDGSLHRLERTREGRVEHHPGRVATTPSRQRTSSPAGGPRWWAARHVGPSGDGRMPDDVLVEERILELRLQQVAYRATLQSVGRALPADLLAFLR